MEKALERNFDIHSNTADIIFDFYETPEQIFLSMNYEHFSPEKMLGEDYKSLDNLEKEDIRILKDLCKKGEGKSSKPREKLT
jgi:hypothetical protein